MNIYDRLLIITAILLISLPSTAQKLDHVLGEVILQPTEGHSIQAIKSDIFLKFGRDGMQGSELVIDQPMEIWSIRFDYSKVNERELLQYLRNNRRIKAAQFNHLLEYRSTIPNDVSFFEQWQYINDGSQGGLEGADLDMDLAWDITTGGLTPNGDTIVVCVIDGGVDLDHEDLVDNLWVNHAEIPNNDIDDDGNGYEDDYLGWNVNQSSDNVAGNNHGTAVAGIVGAKGNNGIGVAGVNWDVKLMIVEGGSSLETQAIKAYRYPLVLRKLYNETNGEKGAFVVATNSSWGTDFGQAADVPLWCAFYDSLGVAGIINCGATINGDTNVDIEGDLPTTCTSDYLIGVTNVDRTDTKVTGAGYGATHIDLGAFGADAYTTSIGGNYGGFGGTSGATPHVTGAVALLYAAPCESFASLSSNDPAAAALLAKKYILDGTDFNESLENITVSNGRLNIFNSVQLLMDNCSTCPLPSSVQVLEFTDTQAKISWIPSSASQAINLQYRIEGTINWTTMNNITGNSITLTNLEVCTNYEYRLESKCPTESSGYSNPFQFKTDGCCEAPSNISEGIVDVDFIELNWNSVLAATGGYTVRYRPTDGGNWSLINTQNNSFIVSDLASCTNYEIQIRSVCSSGPTSYSNSIFVLTGGCGACAEGDYCDSESNNSADEWIEEITIGDFTNTSGNDDGFGDYTEMDNPVFPQGSTLDLSLLPGYSGNAFFEYFKIWIDLDQNGVFEPSELLFESNEPNNGGVEGQISIPNTAVLGSTRMRISMKFVGQGFTNLPSMPCETFDYGEVEDYCVEIAEPISVENSTLNKTLTITPNPFSNQFTVQIEFEQSTDIQVSLINLNGQVISTKTELGVSGQYNVTFSQLSNVAPGIYFVQLLDIESRQFSLQKVIKY